MARAGFAIKCLSNINHKRIFVGPILFCNPEQGWRLGGRLDNAEASRSIISPSAVAICHFCDFCDVLLSRILHSAWILHSQLSFTDQPAKSRHATHPLPVLSIGLLPGLSRVDLSVSGFSRSQVQSPGLVSGAISGSIEESPSLV